MLVLTILMSNAGLASAAPISIESGTLSAAVNHDFEEHFSLRAPQFAITGGGGGYDAPATRFVPRLGLPTDFGGTTTVSSNFHICQSCAGVPFAVQFNGVTFAEPTFEYSGTFHFSSVILNTKPGPDSAPFSFSGSLVGRNVATGQEVFNLLLDGTGVLRTSFGDLGNGALDMRAFEFDFAASVPEPSTWFLIASGIILLLGRRVVTHSSSRKHRYTSRNVC
jgi:hypothetical protein